MIADSARRLRVITNAGVPGAPINRYDPRVAISGARWHNGVAGPR